MNVIDIMTKRPFAIRKTDTLAAACDLMVQKKTRHLLVTEDDGQLVGIISDRDCNEAKASPFAIYDAYRAQAFAEKIFVQRVMTKAPICVEPQCSIQEASNLMVAHRINALPVMQDGRIIGIVTSYDLLKLLAKQLEVAQV